MEQYRAAIAELEKADASYRYDADALSQLTPLEAQANTVFATLRSAELAQVWNQETDLGFHAARSAGLDASNKDMKLWSLIQRMPKGALLHCHFDGTVDVRFLLARAVETAGMCVKASEPLCDVEALYRAEVRFQVLPVAQAPTKGDIYDKAYTPGTWVPFNLARDTFPHPHTYGTTPPALLFPAQNAKSRFDAFAHSLMTLTPHASLQSITNSNQAWAKFITTFAVIAGLLGYEPTLKAYVKQMLRSHAADGIAYTEARVNFFQEFMVRTDGTPDLGHREWVSIYDQAVREVKHELGDRLWDSKIIYTTVRIIDNQRLRYYLEDCIALKKEFPDRIVGFDLVGHEDPGVPLRTYAPELLRFVQRQKEEGITIPFVFHAGETLADGTGADLNLFDAIVLDTKRIGHGVSLSRHPHLTDLCKQRDICVEVCPISNQLLGYADVPAHPSLLPLLNRGVPVALSSDDPAIFENFGLSYDFYQLAISSDATTLASLGVLAKRSIQYALVSPAEKQAWTAAFEAQWDAFLSTVTG